MNEKKGEPPFSEFDSGELDPVIVAVLNALWVACAEARATAWSLAKLSKRAGMPMSTLRRALTRLEAAHLVNVSMLDEGRTMVALNEAGIELAKVLFGEQ